MEKLKIFENFKLDELDPGWIRSVSRDEFLDFDKVPAEYSIFLESEDAVVLLKETSDILKDWIAEESGIDEDSGIPEVSWNTLVALQVNVDGLKAILGYFMSRSNCGDESRHAALRATSLYLTLLSIPGSVAFRVFHENLYSLAIECFALSRYLIPVPRKRPRPDDLENLYQLDGPEPESLTKREAAELIESLNSILYDTTLLLKSFSFKDNPRSLESTVESVLLLTRVEVTKNLFYTNEIPRTASLSSLAHNAFATLLQLCDPRHGSVETTIRLICKHSLPYLLVLGKGPDGAWKSAMVQRETMIDFFKELVDSHKKDAEVGLSTLLQHILADHPDKLELRQKQAVVFARFLNICPEKIYARVIEDLIHFSYSWRIGHRVFAQEVIGKYLMEITSTSNECSSMELSERSRIKKILTAIVLCECNDVSSSVRGKAMSTVAMLTEETQDGSEQMGFREILSSLSSDKHFPTKEVLLRSLRSDEVDPLPGHQTIVSMVLRRTEDERALVRKSALEILKNLLLHFPGLWKEIEVIAKHCRDPSLTIRKFAIQLLTELLESHSSNSTILNKWVKSVVPQIFDIEKKVATKVYECIEKMVFRKLDEDGTLPWRILNKMIDLRMKKHLSKSWNIFVKELKQDPDQILKNIRSSIDKNENIQPAWFLLSTLSESANIKDIEKYYDNIGEILKTSSLVNSLKLEVLKNSMSSLSPTFLETLRTSIHRNLLDFQTHFSLIGVGFDVFEKLLSDGSEIQSIVESCESRISNLDTDNSDFSMNIILTYGQAKLHCNRPVPTKVLRKLQFLLNKSDNVKLKICSLLALGHLGIKEPDIAKQIFPKLVNLARSESTENEKTFRSIIRVNSIKILSDLCKTFTMDIECYLSKLCVCMKDKNPEIREAVIVIFIQLLLEDIIKIKGRYIFHILTMLSDEDRTIAELTNFLVTEKLLLKNKTLMSQQLIPGILHYNNYHHENQGSKRLDDTLTLPGDEFESRRRIIYDFMLEHIDVPGKLTLIVKLTRQILQGALKKTIDVASKEGHCVLKDTLYILNSRFLHYSSLNSKNFEDEALENEGVANCPVKVARNYIAENIRKHRVEVLLPISLELRKLLKDGDSDLVPDICKFCAKIFQEFNKDSQLDFLEREYPKIREEIASEYRKYAKTGNTEFEGEEDMETEEEEENEAPEEERRRTRGKNSPSTIVPSPPLDPVEVEEMEVEDNSTSPESTKASKIVTKRVFVKLRRISSLTEHRRSIEEPSGSSGKSKSTEEPSSK